MQGHPEERLLLERLRTLVEERVGSVSALEERLGLEAGTLDDLRRGAETPTPLSLRWLYRILDTLQIEPREFFSQVYELVPQGTVAATSPWTVAGGRAEDDSPGGEFPHFGRVLDTVRLLVRDAADQP